MMSIHSPLAYVLIAAQCLGAPAQAAHAASSRPPPACGTAGDRPHGAVPGIGPVNTFRAYAFGGADQFPGEIGGAIDAAALPALGDGSGGSLTPAAERRLGERVMRDIRREPGYLDDWLVRDYLDSVASRLGVAARQTYLGSGALPEFSLFAIRDAQVNAFSLPGGFIGMNSGLIATTETESELASVIAHEMGHVLQRHIARLLDTRRRAGYGALAGALFGILAGLVARSADLGEAMVMGSQAYLVDRQLRFSRAAEQEADRVGFRMLQRAGYDPYAMPEFFRRLERASLDTAAVPAYARTHPLTTDRIADMSERARAAPYRQPRQDPEYAFVRARVRVMAGNSAGDYARAAGRLRAEIDARTAPNVAANWYGIALARWLEMRYAEADMALARARDAWRRAVAADKDAGRDAPDSPSLAVLAAQIALRAARPDDALRLSHAALLAWPRSHAALDTRFAALFAAKRYAQARALAEQATRDEPCQPAWWAQRARADAALGDHSGARRALAERFALDGAWPSAIEQLRQARDARAPQGAGFYDVSALDARLHEMERRYQEERDEREDARTL
jgi:predicted Zn-dependent protease